MENLKINVDTAEVKEATAALEALATAADRARKALDALEGRRVSVSVVKSDRSNLVDCISAVFMGDSRRREII